MPPHVDGHVAIGCGWIRQGHVVKRRLAGAIRGIIGPVLGDSHHLCGSQRNTESWLLGRAMERGTNS